MRLRRKPKPPAPPTIRLVPNSHAGHSGYDAYVEGRRVAWGASQVAATESARTSLMIARAL